MVDLQHTLQYHFGGTKERTSQPAMVAVSVLKRWNGDYHASWFSGKWLSASVSIWYLVLVCVSSCLMHFGGWGQRRERIWWDNRWSGQLSSRCLGLNVPRLNCVSRLAPKEACYTYTVIPHVRIGMDPSAQYLRSSRQLLVAYRAARSCTALDRHVAH